MAPSLKLSVVLPTYMRAGVLRRTLQHLTDQTLAAEAYEVIVVDDGSTDGTETVVEEIIRTAPCRIVYLRHENSGPGRTQNVGILRASAPLILLVADDIFLTRGALEAHVAAHARHNDRGVAILGNVVQSPELRQTVFQRKWDPFEFWKLRQNQELPYWMFWACNISLKRDFMLEHGMFRDGRGSAGPASHEDVEVGHRLSKHGLRIFHEKAALAYHYHPESLETAIARSYQRGLNWKEAFQRMPHPELLIRQRLYGIGTLIVRRREIASRRSFLFEADRNMARLALNAALRSILFNRITVPFFWMPLMRRAERNRFLAALMVPRFYRGVIVYSFRRAGGEQSDKFRADASIPAIEQNKSATRTTNDAEAEPPVNRARAAGG
jgi:glycosyltransferase involved in cell wall biosynthesis